MIISQISKKVLLCWVRGLLKNNLWELEIGGVMWDERMDQEKLKRWTNSLINRGVTSIRKLKRTAKNH